MLPELLDIVVGHAGNVVRDGAREALGGDLCLVVSGHEAGIGHESREEFFDDVVGVAVRFFHSRGVIEVGVEKRLGGGAFRLDCRAEGDEPCRRAADLVERGCAQRGNTDAGLVHQIGDQGIEQTPESFVDAELGSSRRIGADDDVVEAAEEGNAVADLFEGEDAGVEAVVEIGGEVGNFVGEVDELSFERWAQVEEVFCQFGMGVGGVVTRMLDDAFADSEGEVEAAICGGAFFEPGNNTEGMQVVIEPQAVGAEGTVKGLFAGMAEGWMANVVGERERFSQVDVQTQSAGECARSLRHFKCVGEAGAEMIAGRKAGKAGEDLGFAGEASKGPRVQDTSAVACEGRAVGMGRLGPCALG